MELKNDCLLAVIFKDSPLLGLFCHWQLGSAECGVQSAKCEGE